MGSTNERGHGQSVPGESGDRLSDALAEVQEIAEARKRVDSRPGRADRCSALVLGVGFVAVALTVAAQAHGLDRDVVAMALPLVALHALASRIEFEAASGSSVPTEPVLVAMFLLLPLPVVPLTVLVALQVAGIPELGRAGRWNEVLVRWTTGWHCLGPTAVLAVAAPGSPSLAQAPVYVAALAAQFAVDAAVAAVRARALGIRLAHLVQPLAWTFATDSLLAPIGLAVVLAGGRSPATVLLLAAPMGLIGLLSRDRAEHLEKAVSISTAYTAVHEQARVDALTGLANRRAWEEAVQAAQRRLAEGSAVAVAVLAADLDGLKAVNDRHGHEAGDDLIVGLARALQAAVPQAAVVARLGGDEFAALVVQGVPARGQDVGDQRRSDQWGPDQWESDQVGSDQLVGDVRVAMAAYRGIGATTLSASLGVATTPPEANVEAAVRAADLRAAEDKIRRKVGRGRGVSPHLPDGSPDLPDGARPS